VVRGFPGSRKRSADRLGRLAVGSSEPILTGASRAIGNPRGSRRRQTGKVTKPAYSKRGVARPFRLLVIFLAVAAGCAKGTGPAASPQPSNSPTSPALARTIPALKLDVLVAVGGHLAYCDPDVFPVLRRDPLESARERFPKIKADRAAFEAILAHEHLSAGQQFTPDELMAINEDYKQMQAIDLQRADGEYRFSVTVPQKGSDVAFLRLRGAASQSGSVRIERRDLGRRPECPICLAAGVLIATPNGEIPVQDVRIGMPVWTTDRQGHRAAGTVRQTGHTQAPLGHEVVRLTLADGRTVIASPGHPTADGRMVGDLVPGNRYNGSLVSRVELTPYSGATWDLLPTGPTGTYFANGVLLGSTLLVPQP
jgi:hypothetical protein